VTHFIADGFSPGDGFNISNLKNASMKKSIPPSVLNLLAEDRDYIPGCLPRYVHRPEDRSHRNGLLVWDKGPYRRWRRQQQIARWSCLRRQRQDPAISHHRIAARWV